MTKTYIQIGSETVASDDVVGTLPDREFRDAWCLEGKAVKLDVGRMKPLAKDKVTAWREAKLTAPLTLLGVTYSADQKSQDLIDRATQLAEKLEGNGATFETEWSDVQGNSVPMDRFKIDQLGIAIGVRTSQYHVAARAKKAEIDAAETEEAIRAVLATLV
jgi:hypothetical protein